MDSGTDSTSDDEKVNIIQEIIKESPKDNRVKVINLFRNFKAILASRIE